MVYAKNPKITKKKNAQPNIIDEHEQHPFLGGGGACTGRLPPPGPPTETLPIWHPHCLQKFEFESFPVPHCGQNMCISPYIYLFPEF